MKISIVIPVYNTEEFLPKCLESVINQTYKNIEIIVVNDCSKGNCEEIIRIYQEKDTRIVYVKHDVNLGLFAARETGVRKATGDYITHLDSDDWLSLDICQKGIQALNDDEDVLFFNYSRVENRGEVSILIYSRDFQDPNLFESIISLKREYWNIWGAFYKKSLLIKVYEELQIKRHLTMSEDLLFFVPMSYYCEKAIAIADIGYYYNCLNETSATKIIRTKELLLEDLVVYDFVLKTHQSFFHNHGIDENKLFKIRQKLCHFHLEQLSSFQNDRTIMNLLLSKTIEVFGGDVVASFIYDVSLTPNTTYIQRKFYKQVDIFFTTFKKSSLFFFLKNLWQKIKNR